MARGRVVAWDPYYRRARWRRGVSWLVTRVPHPHLPPFWSGFFLGAVLVGVVVGGAVVGQRPGHVSARPPFASAGRPLPVQH